MYIFVAYLIGSVPFGYLAGKMNGIDLREHGSHNIGATNAVRVLGKKWGLPVFACDFLKGFLPLLWAKECFLDGGRIETASQAQMAALLGVMLALVLGHTYTCFLRFRGGKGVATMAGCLVAFMPAVAGVAALVFAGALAIWRYVSLASMLAGAAMVAAAWALFLRDGAVSPAEGMALAVLAVIFVLVVYRHRSNITRILNGTESKVFAKKN